MSLPYQTVLELEPAAIRDLLLSTGAAGIRYPSLQSGGLAAGIYVRYAGPYDLQDVQIKHRARVRKALDVYEMRPVPESDLLTQGLQLNLETMARQGRYDSEFGNPARWARFVKAMRFCPEIAATGAYHGDKLCAYMVTCREDRWLHILHQMSRADDLKTFPNHFLTFHVTRQACTDPSLDAVCYGLMSLVALDGLHEYKLRFGYEVAPHASAVRLHPRLDPLLNNRLALWGVKVMSDFQPNNQRLHTLESVLLGAGLASRGRLHSILPQ